VNKANSATIALGAEDPDNPATQHAIESSTASAIKLLQLLGALLRNKDGERGYQDCAVIFMELQKHELYGIDKPRKFPDVSNTRYSCYTYAAAEVVCFHGIIKELVLEVVNGKTKSGQQNHVEMNILKGLHCYDGRECCAGTLRCLCVMALHGNGARDETKSHRKILEFCSHIAVNPKNPS
jgi:hypothetical protein